MGLHLSSGQAAGWCGKGTPGLAAVWRGKGTSGHAAALRLGGRRKAPTALRCAVSWPAAELASFAALTALNHPRRVRRTKRAARADLSPALLAAPEIAPTGHRPPRCSIAVLVRTATSDAAKTGLVRGQ